MSSISGKRLLILGGTQIQCEVINMAKKLGVITVVTDYNKPEDSPGKLICDEHYMVSCTDVDAVVDLIKQKHIDGVLVGFNDMLLPYYAEICEKSDLPCYGTKEQFKIYINKDRYKSLCRQFGVPTVKEYQIDMNHMEESIKNVEYPVLVKPSDSSGARGITICQNTKELLDAIQTASKYSATNVILVEQYLTGRELTVFWIFQEGKYYVSAIGNRHVKHNQEGVIPLPVGYTFPASVTRSYLENIAPNVQKMLSHTGVENGMMFMQCKLENNELIVYDIGFRLTGSMEYKILNRICGFDPLEMMIHFALTGGMADEDISEKVDPEFSRTEKYAFNVSVLSKPGIISDITGIDEVKNMPQVEDVVLAHMPGETITEDMKGLLAQITVRILGTADSLEDMEQTMFRIYDKLDIISDKGESLKLLGLEMSDVEGTVLTKE